jgi:hypothetical protein
MNDIPTLQNDEAQIRLLRARKHEYAQGKRLLALQMLLTVAVPVVGSVSALFWPGVKGIVALTSLVIAILDVTVFDRLQKAILRTAAKIGEQFDCAVLQLPWNQFTVGAKIDPETVHAGSVQYRGGKDDPELRNWYPVIVGTVPLYLARVICQRTNLWYDAKLRRQYGRSAIGITVVLTVLLLIIGMVRGLTIDSFVIGVLAPAAPIIVWGVREYLRQRDTTEVLDRVRSESEALWERAKSGICSEQECTTLSRQFQNAIYERRSNSGLVFD